MEKKFNADGLLILNPIKHEEDCENFNVVVTEDSVISNDKGACICLTNCETLRISSEAGFKLILNPGNQQPAIGNPTHTGMSYGRWSQNEDCKLKRVILDNVELIINSKVPNFSLGSYNYSGHPKVELMNDAKIVGCPEMEGERILLAKAKPPEGSTKISGAPKYVIRKPGEIDDDLMSEELKELRVEINSLNPQMGDYVNMCTQVAYAKAALMLLKLKSDLDISPLLAGDAYDYQKFMLVCCVVLGLPASWAKSSEFLFECRKVDYLFDKYKDLDEHQEDTLERVRCICRSIHNNVKFETLSDWDKRVVYEMIPAYYFDFEDEWFKSAERFYNGVE